jgi:hypothetical protein
MIIEPVVDVLNECREPVTPSIYNSEIDVSENIINACKLSGLCG